MSNFTTLNNGNVGGLSSQSDGTPATQAAARKIKISSKLDFVFSRLALSLQKINNQSGNEIYLRNGRRGFFAWKRNHFFLIGAIAAFARF